VVLGDFLVCFLSKLILAGAWEVFLVLKVVILEISMEEGSES
jgi:hypothetical protein